MSPSHSRRDLARHVERASSQVRSWASYPRIRPATIEIHYATGIGYGAKLNGEDMGIYAADWATCARKVGEQLAAHNVLHPDS